MLTPSGRSPRNSIVELFIIKVALVIIKVVMIFITIMMTFTFLFIRMARPPGAARELLYEATSCYLVTINHTTRRVVLLLRRVSYFYE